MKDYMNPSIFNMIAPNHSGLSGIDVLIEIENKISWPDQSLVNNGKVIAIIEYLKRNLENENISITLFKKMVDLYFAKFLYVNDIPLNGKSLINFITDFFGQEITHVYIDNHLYYCCN
jgi:hypothetical protein